MTTRLRRWAAAAALVLTAGLALTACSGDDDASGEPSASSSDASDEPAGDPLAQDEFVSTVAAAMLEAGSVHVDLDLGTSGTSGEGDVVVGADAASTSLAVSVNGNEIILVDNVYYVNLGQFSGGMFLQVDPESGGTFGETFGGLLDQANPATQLRLFESALTGFEVGDASDEVDGVKTTPYVLTLDPTKVLTPEQLSLAGGDLPASVEVTMLLGPDDLPRRVTTTIAGAEVAIDYTAWGEPVDIAAPPADQVTDGGPFGL
ncbi:hypothetical protein [Aeromicrobium sp. Leaf350]|uniref:hypothetical protein n=1 Tax=Aeromicrobium sp. Leaf350 TaxID=2876565 RepID=UPI001E61955A|nr:hypothetical protein [Aeromicrobium sp. Leaf350]